MKNIINKLNEKKLTIALAESMTGGLLSHLFTKESGASKVFIGSVIAYNNRLKETILDVSSELIKEHSIVSKQVANAMNEGLLKIIDANIYVSITGNAGPNLQEGTKDLDVYISILFNNKLFDYHLNFESNNRLNNINETCVFIIEKIDNLIR